jgi:hypothetical protein
VAGLAMLALAGAWLALFLQPGTEPAPSSLPVASAVELPGELPKQGPNECGAYSLALGLRAHGVEADPVALVERVSQQFAWSDGLSGTLPWRILEVLAEQGLGGTEFTARGVDPALRLDLVRAHLAQGRPVIVLIESERGSQHYVLAVGFREGELDLYDPNAEAVEERPNLTQDQNGARPGNRSVPTGDFLEYWGEGGLLGLYGWWYVPVGGTTKD